MLRYPNVLLFSNDETETAVLHRLLSEHVVLTPVHHPSELTSLLGSNSYDALFWVWSFHTGTWNDALSEVRKITPDLPVIILSSAAEEKEWIQALGAGAFDLLVAPHKDRALLAVLEQASASREARISRSMFPLRKANV